MTTPPNHRVPYQAHIIIYGSTYQVEITRGQDVIAVLTPSEALDLAWELTDAAYEPEHCERGDCDRYGVAYWLCDLHASVAR